MCYSLGITSVSKYSHKLHIYTSYMFPYIHIPGQPSHGEGDLHPPPAPHMVRCATHVRAKGCGRGNTVGLLTLHLKKDSGPSSSADAAVGLSSHRLSSSIDGGHRAVKETQATWAGHGVGADQSPQLSGQWPAPPAGHLDESPCTGSPGQPATHCGPANQHPAATSSDSPDAPGLRS